jgi:hypothetical protein
VVSKDPASSHPDIVRDIDGLFQRSKAMAATKSGAADMRPIGFKVVGPPLELVIDLAYQQQLIRRCFSVADCSKTRGIFSALTPAPSRAVSPATMIS